MTSRAFAAIFVALTAIPAAAQAQPNRLTAHDGDTIIIKGEARVSVIRQRKAHVRVVFDANARTLILLTDYADIAGGPDGWVEQSQTYRALSGDWPMGERWEGAVTIEEYSMAGSPGSTAIGLVFPQGRVVIANGSNAPRPQSTIAVLTSRSSGGTFMQRLSFDDAERRQVEDLQRNSSRSTIGPPGAGVTATARLEAVGGGIVMTEPPTPPTDAPVRVGGNVRQPVKIVDAEPVYPEQAIRAGISGVVIVEATIDKDGSVKEARVLRSIPLLDSAAVEAVRQWRFEPTLLNGVPVPVIMTVTVPFVRR